VLATTQQATSNLQVGSAPVGHFFPSGRKGLAASSAMKAVFAMKAALVAICLQLHEHEALWSPAVSLLYPFSEITIIRVMITGH
jgi:hypothetical protein